MFSIHDLQTSSISLIALKTTPAVGVHAISYSSVELHSPRDWIERSLLAAEALQGKTCQNFLDGVGQFEPRFQGKGSSLGNIFWLLEN